MKKTSLEVKKTRKTGAAGGRRYGPSKKKNDNTLCNEDQLNGEGGGGEGELRTPKVLLEFFSKQPGFYSQNKTGWRALS